VSKARPLARSIIDNAWLDAACLTCRKKSRRCDRARPKCKRCISKGLQCEGYPDKFRFCGIASRGKWQNREAPILAQGTPDGSSSQNPPQVNQSDVQLDDELGSSATVSNKAGLAPREIDRLLASAEVETLLTHCKLVSVQKYDELYLTPRRRSSHLPTPDSTG